MASFVPIIKADEILSRVKNCFQVNFRLQLLNSGRWTLYTELDPDLEYLRNGERPEVN